MPLSSVLKNNIQPFQFGTGKFWKASNGQQNQVLLPSGVKRKDVEGDEKYETESVKKFKKVLASPALAGVQTRGPVRQGIPLIQWKSIPSLKDHIDDPEVPFLYYKNGTTKTGLDLKKDRDMQEFKSRFKIDPYIPKLDEEWFEGQLVDMINNDRYHITEESDWQTAFKKQRSAFWYQNRKGKITGSKTTSVVMSFGERDRKICYYETFDDQNPELARLKSEESQEEKERSQEFMGWGTFNEIQAHATILRHLGASWNIEISECILSTINPPPYFVQAFRESFKRLFNIEFGSDQELKQWIITAYADSPDGKLFYRNTNTFCMIEIKTPNGNRCPVPYEKVKYYYYLQMQLHLLTLEEQYHTKDLFCLFVSWSPTITRIFKVMYDPLVWKLSMDLFVEFLYYGHFAKKCPEKAMNPDLVEFVDYYIKNASERNSEIVGEYPSCFSSVTEDELKEAKQKIWLEKQTPEFQAMFKQREAEEAIKAKQEEEKAAKK